MTTCKPRLKLHPVQLGIENHMVEIVKFICPVVCMLPKFVPEFMHLGISQYSHSRSGPVV